MTTTVSGTNVQIDWIAPSDNQDIITGYVLKIVKSDGTYLEDTAVCDGVALKNTFQCIVPMTTLTASPYLLGFGDLVSTIISATNSVGSSSFSEANTSGASVQT